MPMRPSPSASTIWRWCPSPIAAHAALAAGAGNFEAIYGSTFFMATGFHGFHVIIGTIFLTVCLFRAIAGQFTPDPPFRLRGGGLVLALRRRGVAVPVRLHLCVGRRARHGGLSHATAQHSHAPSCSGLCPRCGQGPLFDGYIALAASSARPAAWTTPCSMPATGRWCSAS